MVYPIDRIEDCKKTRNRWFGILFGFSVGAFSNLVPFLDIWDLGSVTPLQWLFLAIDATVFIISLVIYMFYWSEINRIKKRVVQKS